MLIISRSKNRLISDFLHNYLEHQSVLFVINFKVSLSVAKPKIGASDKPTFTKVDLKIVFVHSVCFLFCPCPITLAGFFFAPTLK